MDRALDLAVLMFSVAGCSCLLRCCITEQITDMIMMSQQLQKDSVQCGIRFDYFFSFSFLVIFSFCFCFSFTVFFCFSFSFHLILVLVLLLLNTNNNNKVVYSTDTELPVIVVVIIIVIIRSESYLSLLKSAVKMKHSTTAHRVHIIKCTSSSF